ncbi:MULTISPECIES: Ldh family oxidoreductase [Bordetella]|uniref:Lactate dehydrogenase n=1 Tax=Bordetella genomosp. 6 TaxID=463024 RepID=A0ABX4FEZ4_9BORD|nr:MULTISPECIES: Ldh family oxidoreductase [Bordetella]AZW46002.1 lactate dehydrogenase [Bordetella bronchiseptica]KCV60524.1 malate/L-lactate dehydrogenase [Bordetella bronchiseptica 99-R-0433]OZI80513.1 lactate dehydrogenase [Bordetella genomosp. 6]
MAHIYLDELQHLAAAALAAAGAHPEMAESTARALVHADSQGLVAQGVARVPGYAAHLRTGRAKGAARPRLAREHGGTALIDAGSGLAYPACALAAAQATERARQHGVAFVAVVNSHHFGAAAYHLEAIAAAGMVGLAVGNSPAAMPAWGGRRPLLGTNPVAAAFPRRRAAPLEIDLTPAEATRGQLMIAARDGEPIPEGWALDAEGRPTTDPRAGLAGTILPAAGAKGTMLALIIELLVCSLSGAQFGFETESLFDDEGGPARLGQAFLAIDPAALAGTDTYLERVETLIEAMLHDDGVRLPGERRIALRKQALQHGVDIPDTLLAQLRGMCGAG